LFSPLSHGSATVSIYTRRWAAWPKHKCTQTTYTIHVCSAPYSFGGFCSFSALCQFLKAPTHLLPCAWISFASHLCASFYSLPVVYFSCAGCSIFPTRNRTVVAGEQPTKLLKISANLSRGDARVHCVSEQKGAGDMPSVITLTRAFPFTKMIEIPSNTPQKWRWFRQLMASLSYFAWRPVWISQISFAAPCFGFIYKNWRVSKSLKRTCYKLSAM
jgi:hypothetical protein